MSILPPFFFLLLQSSYFTLYIFFLLIHLVFHLFEESAESEQKESVCRREKDVYLLFISQYKSIYIYIYMKLSFRATISLIKNIGGTRCNGALKNAAAFVTRASIVDTKSGEGWRKQRVRTACFCWSRRLDSRRSHRSDPSIDTTVEHLPIHARPRPRFSFHSLSS